MNINSFLLGLYHIAITLVAIGLRAVFNLVTFTTNEFNKFVKTTVARMRGGYYCGLLSFALYVALGHIMLRWPNPFHSWLFLATGAMIFASYFLTIIYNSFLWKDMPHTERFFKAGLYIAVYLLPMVKGTFIGLALLHHGS